jgi:hypothetical protein
LHAATSALILTTLNYPTSNDEYKHLSYVFQVERDRQLFPDYHDLYLAAPEKAGVPLSKRSDLKHPAFFYWLMTPLADPEQSAAENAARFRIANFILSVIAVGIFLFASARLLNSPGALVTYGLTVVAFPFLAVVGGTFNNDNLALLGAALAFMGVVRMARGEIGVAAGGLMGAGLAIAGLAKLTGALTVGFFILFAHFITRSIWLNRAAGRNAHFSILLLGGLVGAIPYLATIVLYGYLMPTEDPFFWLMGPTVQTLPPLTYLVHFITRLASTWPMYELDMATIASQVAIFVFALWALLGVARRDKDRMIEPIQVIIFSGLLAFFLTLAINIGFIYQIHQKTGDLANMSVRYFLPVWPMIALAAAHGATNMKPARAKRLAPFILVGLMMVAYLQPFVAGLFSPQTAMRDFISYLPDLKPRDAP